MVLMTLLFFFGAVGDCGVIIPNATCTTYDTTAPIIGTAYQQRESDGSYTVGYADFFDALAGIDTVSLWYKTLSGDWVFSGQTSTNSFGQFTVNTPNIQSFKLVGLDKATNEVVCILNLGDTVKPIIVIKE